MANPQNVPRQQHYVPRFYLEGFCDPFALKRGKRLLWVYEKGKPIRASSPRNECRERDFYTYVSPDGERDGQVEAWLGRIEDAVAPLIRKLGDVRCALTAEEREWMALFVGTLFTRTPTGRAILDTRSGPAADRLLAKSAEDSFAFRELCAELSTTTELANIDIESIRMDILNGKMNQSGQSTELSLGSVVAVGKMCAESLLKLDWQFIHADGSEWLVTSDNPIVSAVWNENDKTAHFRMGFDVDGADVSVPLSRTILLRMKKGIEPGPCRFRADRAVRYINKSAMISADKRIYAAERSERLRTLFEKHGCQITVEQFEPRWKGKVV